MVRAIQRELVEFKAQKYLFKSFEDLPSTDIRPRYRKLRMREQALLLASEDLCPLLEKSGLMQDARKTKEEVDYLLTPITNIKLTYMDLVSNVTSSVSQEADVESTVQPMPSHRTASPEISPSTHYHAVVCNSATCLGDRVQGSP